MRKRYELINMLSRSLGHHSVIKPALIKLALKAFGGYMDIEEFRASFASPKLLINNMPPMITSVQQLEEVNEGNIMDSFKYTLVDTEKTAKRQNTSSRDPDRATSKHEICSQDSLCAIWGPGSHLTL